jgi:hypothetical protein
MEYGKIIAVTGLPGLYELVSSKNDGAIVRSLDDKSRFVSSRIHNVSHLESIEVYTSKDNVNLVDIFNAMESSGTGLPDDRDANAVKGYFEKVYPDLDFDRVYNSDMKKMIKWFSLLKDNQVEIKLTELPEEEEEVLVEEPVKEEKKAKQVKGKKAAAEEKPKAEKPAAKKAVQAPKKKAAPKAKKEESGEKKKETPKKK